QGFIIHGADPYDRSGFWVSSAGDVNRDGFDDLMLSVPFENASGVAFAGESFVIFGTDVGFGASIALAALTPAQGFIIHGADPNDRSGFSVSSAGDVNGDGFDDLIIGVPFENAPGVAFAGESFVI